MKTKAKALCAAVLAAILLVTASVFPVAAEEAQANKNYLTAKWTADVFAGSLTENDDNGVTVIEYIPASAYSWFSPTLDVFGDLKTLIGDRQFAVVNICFEIQCATDLDELESHAHVLFRAVNPKDGGISFPAEQVGDWDGEGGSWSELYKEKFDSDLEFYIENQNNYAFPEDATLEITKSGWTYYETGPIAIAAADLDDTLFGGWLLCVDNMDYDAKFLKGIHIRNTAIYDCSASDPTQAPTEAATEAPTQAAATGAANTDAPVQAPTAEATTVNAATATPAGQGSNNGKTEGNKVSAGLILGIIGGVIVAAAVVVGIIAARKKKAK